MLIEEEEIFVLPYDDDSNLAVIYCPLRDYVALASSTYAAQLAGGTLPSDLRLKLQQRTLINIRMLHGLLRSGPPDLSLAVTDNCNLACRYCHHNAGAPTKTRSMSKPLLEQALARYLSDLPQGAEARITFAGGGEPTYDFALFEFAIERAKALAGERGLNVTFRMATNGCYGKRVGEYVAKTFRHVSLSFDGPRDIQDMHRPTKGGGPTFDLVYKTAKLLRESPVSLAFRATVSDRSVKRLAEVVEFFASEFPGCNLGLEPLNPFGRAVGDCELLPPSRDEFAEALLQVEKIATEKPITLANAAIGKFDALRTIFCGAVSNPNWTVGTDGSVSCCTRDNAPDVFMFGRFGEDGTLHIDQDKLDRISAMNVFNYAECENCFCKYHCAGDCPDLRVTKMLRCSANQRIGQFWLAERLRRAMKLEGASDV